MTNLIITAAELVARRAAIANAPDLRAADVHLKDDLDRLMGKALYVPPEKALFSRYGQQCRDDGAILEFDPYQPMAQRCPKCGRVWNTEQTHRWWVYWYQVWHAERVLCLALNAGAAGSAGMTQRALDTLVLTVERYPQWPNHDNVLGPTRPFFSTYLESIWVLHLVTAVSLLEGQGCLPQDLAGNLRANLFRVSAGIIADYDEKRSNRQVWNSAALYALGRYLGNDALAHKAAHEEHGLLWLLENQFLKDGLWYEGENYHWFALRGMTWGAELLRVANDIDLWTDGGTLGKRFRSAFRAPVLTALPDFTFPARRDSKFGVTLRQRRMAELWELALARTDPAQAGTGSDRELYASLLAHIYDPTIPDTSERWREVTDVERAAPATGVRRGGLGWKAWLWMLPELPEAPADAWRVGTQHLEDTGLAIFRRDGGQSYVSVDYGDPGGGHGHPDRLNLTAVVHGVPWLLDFGTASYADQTLAWYRSTLAHNAPIVDGQSQKDGARGYCLAFDDQDGYGWVCATLLADSAYQDVTLQRTVVVTPAYVLDIMQLSADGAHFLALPWHGLADTTGADEHGLVFSKEEGTLRVHLSARQKFMVMQQQGLGPTYPNGDVKEMAFQVVVSEDEFVTLVACLDTDRKVQQVDCKDGDYIVRMTDGSVHIHHPSDTGWLIDLGHGDPVALDGLYVLPEPEPPPKEEGPPFTIQCTEPIVLEREDQYRRTEDPYPGPAGFSARGFVSPHDEGVRLTLDVVSPHPYFRPGDAENPYWDNDPVDIHSNGIQVYVSEAGRFGWLIVPDTESDKLRVRVVGGTDGTDSMILGGHWRPTDDGYHVEFVIALHDEKTADEVFLDLYVNQARSDRDRRVGQLVWSGNRSRRAYGASDQPLTWNLPGIFLK